MTCGGGDHKVGSADMVLLVVVYGVAKLKDGVLEEDGFVLAPRCLAPRGFKSAAGSMMQSGFGKICR